MTPFAAKLKSGESLLGLGLSDHDLLRIKTGHSVVIDLSQVGVGLWTVHPEDGGRTFIQPRDSKIVVIAGDTKEDIGEFLRVDLP